MSHLNLNMSITAETFDVTNSYRYVLNDICKKYNLTDKNKIKILENQETFDEEIFYDNTFVANINEVTSTF